MGTPRHSDHAPCSGIRGFLDNTSLSSLGRNQAQRGCTRCGVNLIIGLLSNDPALFPKVEAALERAFGKIDLRSEAEDFTHTDYYTAEMGEGLKRKFLSFKKLFRLENIYKVKITTNRIEQRFARAGRRTVNIDPGYIDHSKLVLFSTKDYSHRIYLRKGIFAEVTLFYKDRRFDAWPWTYPDYKTKSYIAVFDAIRERYRQKMKGA